MVLYTASDDKDLLVHVYICSTVRKTLLEFLVTEAVKLPKKRISNTCTCREAMSFVYMQRAETFG